MWRTQRLKPWKEFTIRQIIKMRAGAPSSPSVLMRFDKYVFPSRNVWHHLLTYERLHGLVSGAPRMGQSWTSLPLSFLPLVLNMLRLQASGKSVGTSPQSCQASRMGEGMSVCRGCTHTQFVSILQRQGWHIGHTNVQASQLNLNFK